MTRFEEVQRTPGWAWLAIALPVLGAWFGAFWQLFLGRPVGTAPASDAGMAAIWLFLGVAAPALFLRMRLRTVVEDARLRVRLWPFPTRTISLHDVADARAESYRPIREFGGWGIRFGRAGARAYSMSGDRGVRLTLRNGKTVMIGSRRAEELTEAVTGSRSAR